ncbi:MAG: lysophospholipid acyltransferase family protein [Verrucomicrobia bacterium]|nr:lysophospholipid acyltransferase family protein [Verrucomicrobiota bacterium]
MHPIAPQTDLPVEVNELALPRNAWYSPVWFEVASRLIQGMPRCVTRSFSAGVGRLGYAFCHSRRRAVLQNLEPLIPDPAQRDLACRHCFRNFLRMLHDFCDCAAGGTPRVNALMVERRGFEALAAARARGCGTLLITGHLGAWELGGMLLAGDGFPMNIVTLEEPTEKLNRWRQQFRNKFGIKTITVGSDKFAFVEIIQALKKNELVAMLVDRPYLRSGVPVRFFGRQTLFSAAAATIWQHTGAAIVPAFVLELSPGRYGCYAYPAVEMRGQTTLQENTQEIATVFQGIFRRYPEQWFNFVPVWQFQA